MKALIIDDEILAQKSLARNIRDNAPDVEIIGYASSVKEAVAWLNEPANKPDIIFMDVELSDGDCFSIFRQCEIQAKVIMTTAYDSYALKAFEAGSVDYLLKPVDSDALRRAVSRCESRSNTDIQALMNLLKGKPAKNYKERIIVKFNDNIVPVKVQDIAFIYSEEKNNYMVTFEGKKYILDSALDDIADDFDPVRFFKISRKAIVSLPAIEAIQKQQSGRLKIVSRPESAVELIVSRARVDEFMTWLEA